MAKPAKKSHGDFEKVDPNPSAMIESLRAFGYSLPTAIADLMDNSISAGAKNIWLTFFWNGPESHISILDDGRGMSEETLREAMRPGTQSPLDERSPEDLGRFGLGLKTASFSQCRRLTVTSKAKGHDEATRRWDLDYVKTTGEWRLLKSAAEGSEPLLSNIDSLKQGTLVLWENMDRVVSDTDVDSEADQRHFLRVIDEVQEHIAMVFHRFLMSPSPLKVFINGIKEQHRVKPWDPFLEGHAATQLLPAEPLSFRKSVVTIRPFVLPHIDMLGDKLHDAASGPAGWNGQQGFYVYRNKRMLVAGDWLGLGFTKEEHYKLARIQVDIPNSMDGDWSIDVKKSRARPPAPLRDRLKCVADLTRKRAVEVYRHRGMQGAKRAAKSLVFAWKPERRKGKIVYVVNRDHPLVQRALDVPPEHKPAIQALLRLLEETVPVQQIWLDAADQPNGHGRPFETAAEKDVQWVMTQVYAAMRKSGLTSAEAKERLASMEAFASYVHLIKQLPESIDQ
jgi:hypothetical protein